MSRIDSIDDVWLLYEVGMEYFEGMNGYSDDGSSKTVTMPETAMEYFIKAAEKGHAASQLQLAVMYEKGEGCEVDIGKAVKWYKAAAEKNYKEAIDALKRLEK